LLLTGVRAEDIDRAMVQFGFPVGPITLLDEVGLDVAQHACDVLVEAFGERMEPAKGLGALVKDGRLGRKAGRGFYTYSGGKKGGVDPSVYPLLGVQPNGGIPTSDIVQQMTYAMLNEAARAAAEGVVRSPRDGDIGAIYGFGFPPFRGGPLRYLDDLGADRVYADLQRLADRLGPRFTPSEAIVEQARARKRFYP
jgi:3-hydroxyacyl-CoA dehydrogenase/enoyl-CoA hydratase/3-hydroxybutyryl-CoA epimerase